MKGGDITRSQSGLTLVELMIAMLLGLIIVGGAVGMFLANKRTYMTTENISRIQENARISFELMAREIREAGGTPCGADLPVANVVNGAPGLWWMHLGVMGFEGDQALASVPFGATAGGRVNGTDAIQLGSGVGNGISIVEHVVTSARFDLSDSSHDLKDGDFVMVCDFEQASIFQVTSAQSGINSNVVHNTGVAGVSPGNCTKGLGLPVVCTTNGTPKEYTKNSALVIFRPTLWFIGCNSRTPCANPGGRSLYKLAIGSSATVSVTEMVEGVHDMQIQYMEEGAASYVDANEVTDWQQVTAVSLELTLVGPDAGVTTSNDFDAHLVRTMTHVVALRNRVR